MSPLCGRSSQTQLPGSQSQKVYTQQPPNYQPISLYNEALDTFSKLHIDRPSIRDRC